MEEQMTMMDNLNQRIDEIITKDEQDDDQQFTSAIPTSKENKEWNFVSWRDKHLMEKPNAHDDPKMEIEFAKIKWRQWNFTPIYRAAKNGHLVIIK